MRSVVERERVDNNKNIFDIFMFVYIEITAAEQRNDDVFNVMREGAVEGEQR